MIALERMGKMGDAFLSKVVLISLAFAMLHIMSIILYAGHKKTTYLFAVLLR